MAGLIALLFTIVIKVLTSTIDCDIACKLGEFSLGTTAGEIHIILMKFL